MNERSRRVLVVDDDADIRVNITDILNDLGYETAMAGDGEAALQCVRAGRFEVVVLDYKMPGMDGVTLCREIEKLQPSIATIMVVDIRSLSSTVAVPLPLFSLSVTRIGNLSSAATISRWSPESERFRFIAETVEPRTA